MRPGGHAEPGQDHGLLRPAGDFCSVREEAERLLDERLGVGHPAKVVGGKVLLRNVEASCLELASLQILKSNQISRK